jgi:hypothetical protein
MAVCCQNLTLGALSSSSELSMLVGELFKKFGYFLNTICILMQYHPVLNGTFILPYIAFYILPPQPPPPLPPPPPPSPPPPTTFFFLLPFFSILFFIPPHV